MSSFNSSTQALMSTADIDFMEVYFLDAFFMACANLLKLFHLFQIVTSLELSTNLMKVLSPSENGMNNGAMKTISKRGSNLE